MSSPSWRRLQRSRSASPRVASLLHSTQHFDRAADLTQELMNARVWRAALEDARTGERHGFADLARLCAFLDVLTTTGGQDDAHVPPGKS
jgi:hypothetical protein